MDSMVGDVATDAAADGTPTFLRKLKELRGLDRKIYAALVHAADTIDQAADAIEDDQGDMDGDCAQGREDARWMRGLAREFAEAHQVADEGKLEEDVDGAQRAFDEMRKARRAEHGTGFASASEEWEQDEARKERRSRIRVALKDGHPRTCDEIAAAATLPIDDVLSEMTALGDVVERVDGTPERFRLRPRPRGAGLPLTTIAAPGHPEAEPLESPYAAPGGDCCMYCGTTHSSGDECRPPCTEPGCTWRGVPWKDDAGETTPAKCSRHCPSGGTPLPVEPPKKGA